FTDPAPTEFYTLSLHDALPILNEKGPTCGAFAKPSDGLEPSTPPYHGGFGASRACTRDHSRHTLSCKSRRSKDRRCVARRRACRFWCVRFVSATCCLFSKHPTGGRGCE